MLENSKFTISTMDNTVRSKNHLMFMFDRKNRRQIKERNAEFLAFNTLCVQRERQLSLLKLNMLYDTFLWLPVTFFFYVLFPYLPKCATSTG